MAEPSMRSTAQLKTLMKLAYIMETAGDGVLGRGAPVVMYQAGLDAGYGHAGGIRATEDVNEALMAVLAEGDEAWQFEEWREPGQEELWIQKGDTSSKWLIFRRCPLMLLARRTGTTPGGVLCQAMHGYVAGCMSDILDRRVDLRTHHCGTRACKVLLELRS